MGLVVVHAHSRLVTAISNSRALSDSSDMSYHYIAPEVPLWKFYLMSWVHVFCYYNNSFTDPYFLSLPVPLSMWAQMHHFLSVRLDLTKIDISKFHAPLVMYLHGIALIKTILLFSLGYQKFLHPIGHRMWCHNWKIVLLIAGWVPSCTQADVDQLMINVFGWDPLGAGIPANPGYYNPADFFHLKQKGK